MVAILLAAMLQAEYQPGEVRRPYVETSVSFMGRFGVPGGGDVTVDGLTYGDLFDHGWGASVEGDLLYDFHPDLWLGGYVSLGFDTFDGDREADSFGDTMEPDRMDIYSLIVGGRAVQYFGEVAFWEGRIGLGVAHYGDVDARFVLGGVPSDAELFEASTRAIFDMGARLGFGTPRVTGDFGFGLRIAGAPRRGDGVTSFVDPESLGIFYLEAGVTLRF